MLPPSMSDSPKMHYFGGSNTNSITFLKSPCNLVLTETETASIKPNSITTHSRHAPVFGYLTDLKREEHYGYFTFL
uniref:Putative ovule protein n=1 Tax=Solanum chacoense TaxID=4108 RepID=A0A0V0GKQ3_SOLCH